ncbi:MAG: GTP-binding protein, partial [Patescibacteria group bacterium]|nr:GTP-binding protein [Patescibacteria group bacterium]
MQKIRNLAIIAHVDHGKTTLTDQILKQCHVFRDAEAAGDLILDSGAQEKERGITITAKNCSVTMPNGDKLNIIDTPGHSDFGSEVERVLGMADACLLVVDAFEGAMPQTRFVLRHALSHHLKIIVIFNKIDKPNIRKDYALHKIFDLFIDLGADDEQCDFPYLFAIGREGRVGKECDASKLADNLDPLFEMIEKEVKPKKVVAGETQIQINALAYDKYFGRIAIGRISRGEVISGQLLSYQNINNEIKAGRIQKLFTWDGISRKEQDKVLCNDIVGIAGFPEITIGDTFCSGEIDPLPRKKIEEPTLEVLFCPNSSPFSGQEGTYVTGRNIEERLYQELETNVGLRVTPVSGGYKVAGRGELHIGVLLENMRREGYEVAVGKPQVLLNSKGEEPYEEVFIDVPDEKVGLVIEQIGKRKGEMLSIHNSFGRTFLRYRISTRGLLGFKNAFIVLTNGEGTITSAFDSFGPKVTGLERTRNGAMISGEVGNCAAYALDTLQHRGTLFVKAGDKVYEGQIVG